jgi:xylulokinase
LTPRAGASYDIHITTWERGASIYAIGCDVGTQSLKGVAVDDRGRPVARAAVPYPTSYPRPGWAEQDPRQWAEALAKVTRSLVDALGGRPGEIRSLGIAGQVDGIVAVDCENAALGPAPIWMDRRATSQTAAIGRRVDGARIRSITGLNLDPSHGAPKIAWLREAGDERSAATGFLAPVTYLVASISGERVIDHANASSTMLYDVIERAWSPALLDAIAIDAPALGRISAADQVIGTLRPAAAETLGLTTDCMVVVGTGDEHAACLAAGALEPGVICDISGTAEPVASASPRPTIDPEGLVETHAHVLDDRWLLEHPGFVSAGSVRWLAEDLLGVAQSSLADLASEVPAGAEGVTFIPALGGAMTPRWNERVRGSFHGLALGHDRRQLARALFEGCAFALRDIVDRLTLLGLASDRIRVVGGGARNRLWLQVKADATNRAVEVLAEPEATAAGAAMLAATGGGFFPDLLTAVQATLALDDEMVLPDPAAIEALDDAYGRYRRGFDALEPTYLGRP